MNDPQKSAAQRLNRLIPGAILLLAFQLGAQPLRVSFLADEKSLDETADLFLQNGSSAESITAFKRAVRFHKIDLVDTSRFPKSTEGFYSFASVADLNAAMPDPFCETTTTNDIQHNSLVCLDVAVLLIKDAGAKAPRLADGFSSKYFTKVQNHGSKTDPDYSINPIPAYSFYAAGKTLLYPTNGYTYITGLIRTTNEVNLGISLKGDRSFPGAYTNNDPAIRKLFATRNELQKQDGLAFPKNIKVVCGSYISLTHHFWCVDHVAVCLENKGKLILLEKNGSCGPFLRIDFNDEQEIGEYMAHLLQLAQSSHPKGIYYRVPIVVSLNDRLINITRP